MENSRGMELGKKLLSTYSDYIYDLHPLIHVQAEKQVNSGSVLLDNSGNGFHFANAGVSLNSKKEVSVNGVISGYTIGGYNPATLLSIPFSIFLIVAIPDLSVDHKIFSNNPISSGNTGFIMSTINNSLYVEWQASGWRNYVHTFTVPASNNQFFLYELHFVNQNTLVVGANGNSVMIISPADFQLSASNNWRLGSAGRVTLLKDLIVFPYNMTNNPEYSNLISRLLKRI